ncbi:MAG: extracellular solute-binding protein [Fibrobacteria bacterium]|nr:extracellular solute-binding protein [Fibrobacteria bacterium]
MADKEVSSEINKAPEMAKDTLRIWLMPTQVGSRTNKHFARAAAAFRKAHPRLPLEIRVLPWSIAWAEIMRAFKRGDPPDVLQVGTSWTSTLGHLGFLAEVPTGVDDRPLIAPWMAETVRHDGKVFGVPWVAEGSGLVARQDILDSQACTLSSLSHWEGFLRICRNLAQDANPEDVDPRHPLPLGVTCRPEPGTLHNVYPWLASGGWDLPSLLVANGPVLAHPSVRAGFEFLGEVLRTNHTSRESGAIQPYRLTMDFYQEGKYAFLIGNPWMVVRKLVDPTAGMESRHPVTFLPIPDGPCGPARRGGGSVLAVSAQAGRRELPWELVRFLTSDTFMDPWTQISGDPPAHEGSLWERHGDHPDMVRLRQMLASSQPYPAHPMWTTIERVLARGVSDLLWRMLAGESFDAKALAAAESTDQELRSILELAWDIDT